MDPADLLYLISNLSGTIRSQQDQINALQAEVARLNEQKPNEETPSPSSSDKTE